MEEEQAVENLGLVVPKDSVVVQPPDVDMQEIQTSQIEVYLGFSASSLTPIPVSTPGSECPYSLASEPDNGTEAAGESPPYPTSSRAPMQREGSSIGMPAKADSTGEAVACLSHGFSIRNTVPAPGCHNGGRLSSTPFRVCWSVSPRKANVPTLRCTPLQQHLRVLTLNSRRI
ncbi:hypothetical protein CCR75_007760 [Bremia lactucae]|uniref:Uncharacterized protein n=1 Tax=Bremia lactucae TaxID=4779 RepID=A0A976IIA1_BRELC|nr:hypothetical protein CCR75_007760 [Bremia lactucae]